MDIVSLAITLILVLAIIGIAWAVIQRLSLPPFAMTVIYVVAGIIAILFLARFLGGGGPHLNFRH